MIVRYSEILSLAGVVFYGTHESARQNISQRRIPDGYSVVMR